MRKLTKSLRMVKLLEILNEATPKGGITLKELVQICNVSSRQIYRDINDLESQLGIRLIRPQVGQKNHGKYLLEGTYLKNISPEMAIVIYLSTLTHKGSILAGEMNNIKNILFNALIGNRFSIEHIDSLQDKIYFVSESLTNSQQVAQLFGKIITAIKEHYRLGISYYTPSRQTVSQRIVEPYGLLCKLNTWYLVGFCQKANEVRTFRIDNIIHGRILTLEKFHPTSDFSIDEYMGEAWGVVNDHRPMEVILHFEAEAAFRVKRTKFHQSQTIMEEKEDGSIIVKFYISGLLEMQLWLMQWKTQVKVLEPKLLKQEMAKLLAAMLEQYQ